MLDLANLSAQMAPQCVPERDYPLISTLPVLKRVTAQLEDLPPEWVEDLLSYNPTLTSARIGYFIRKGQEFFLVTGANGSRDGLLPILTREVAR